MRELDYTNFSGNIPPATRVGCSHCGTNQGQCFPFISAEVKTSFPPIYTWYWRCIVCLNETYGGDFRPTLAGPRTTLVEIFAEENLPAEELQLDQANEH